MPERGTVLLIHGAWQGAWVWDGLAPSLAAEGWRPVAPDLPGMAEFGGHLDVARAALTGDGPIRIVAHSGGGVLATALAEAMPERVAQVIYVCGMMLPSGATFPEMVAPFAADPRAAGITAHLKVVPGGTLVPPDAALEVFYHDAPRAAAEAAAARLVPWADAVRAPRVTHTKARAGRVPRAYIRCGRDRSVLPEVQDAMCAAWPGATIRRLDCGHAPMLAAPEALEATLLDLLLPEAAPGDDPAPGP